VIIFVESFYGSLFLALMEAASFCSKKLVFLEQKERLEEAPFWA
jgi:hypothetical protein